MGSNVVPYFIVTAEKVTNPKDLANLKSGFLNKTPPITPAPSGASTQHVSGESPGKVNQKNKSKKFVKYKIPVKEVRLRESMNKKMEMIKAKLEQSRERFNQMKQRQGDPDLKCEPTVIGLTETGDLPFKMDRSVSDLGPITGRRKANGSFPYVYFVVSDNKITDDEDELTLDNGEKIKSKSADKRRRVRIVEENRMKRDKTKEKLNQVAKIQGLARELGLKSSIDAKLPDSKVSTRPSINQIVFPGSTTDLSQQKTTVHSIHSPSRMPPCTPATTIMSGHRHEFTIEEDTDDNVPRKPFLSGPLYSGKAHGNHAFSTPTFDLPVITPEQKRRALGLGSAVPFDDFAFSAKPKSEHRQRKVTFADSLPVIRGSGFVVNHSDIRDILKLDIPSLGGRAMTMGSITLPSEKLDKQSMCQKFLLGENVSSARAVKKFGTPLPLPKIDIVSNVYDEMIIKMIQEYLQDSNTPTRQSHLAKELLIHLQKHNEHMKKMTVPAPTREHKRKLEKTAILKQHIRLQKKIEMNSNIPPPNTAEDPIRKVMTPPVISPPLLTETSEYPTEVSRDIKNEEKQNQNPRSVPFVQITFKSKDGESIETNSESPNGTTTNSQPKPKSALSEKSRDRANLCSVTPISFQMAPPGLSKEDTMSSGSLQLKT